MLHLLSTMKINFIEEYPTNTNLAKLNLIDFPVGLSLGFKHLADFVKAKHKIERNFKQIKEITYWPLLDLSEGYWLSAFSSGKAIERIIKEMDETGEFFPVLWDAELPILNKKLFVTQLSQVFDNRNLIHQALLNPRPQHPLIVAEIPRNSFLQTLGNLTGTSFPFKNYYRLDMLYTSMMKGNNKSGYLRQTMRTNKQKYLKYSVAFGLIAEGEEKMTTLLTPLELDRDLEIAKEEGIDEIFIYRLGGLNYEYLKVLRHYANWPTDN